MFDKYIYNFLNWLLGVAGTISAWAWREHTKILRKKQKEGKCSGNNKR